MKVPRHVLPPMLWVALSACLGVACESAPPPGATQTVQPSVASPPEIEDPPAPSAEQEPPTPPAASEQPKERPPWDGPFLAITRSSSGIYSEPTFSKQQKIGYAQRGARVPVLPDKIDKENCSKGWYQLVDGGYVCSNHGTTNLDDPEVKFGPKQPDLEGVLPYRYARNTKNGTPLYKSVPSKEQVRVYEPYLFADAKPKKAEESAPKPEPEPIDDATRRAREDQARRMEALRAARRAMLGEAAVQPAKAEEPNPELAPKAATPSAAGESKDAGSSKSWWQEEDPELHKLTIEDLRADGDDVLSSRLVKGFYIAVDKVFDWNKRRWLKSTQGHVAPADRFHFTSGSEFRGVELNEEQKLPVGWIYGWKDKKPTYTIDPETKQLKTKGSLERFSAVFLTGKEIDIAKKTYVESTDGYWVRKRDLRITKPGPPPPEVGPSERWVDVNLSTQTVVLYQGLEPVYATLTSSGKTHKDKEKDHSTPLGKWRIREKHVTTTMDGDGSAAGDLPYSIQAVPYVMYFHRAYALHGAFWHSNYGVQMSHGCVNLSPLDAKHIFFHTDPPVAEGWHGAWSNDDRLGSWVVVHE